MDTTYTLPEIDTLWTDPAAYDAMRRAQNPYGDGQAANKIASDVARTLLSGADQL